MISKCSPIWARWQRQARAPFLHFQTQLLKAPGCDRMNARVTVLLSFHERRDGVFSYLPILPRANAAAPACAALVNSCGGLQRFSLAWGVKNRSPDSYKKSYRIYRGVPIKLTKAILRAKFAC